MQTLKQLKARLGERFDKKFLNENQFDSRSPLSREYQNGGVGRMTEDVKSFLSTEVTDEVLKWVLEVVEDKRFEMIDMVTGLRNDVVLTSDLQDIIKKELTL